MLTIEELLLLQAFRLPPCRCSRCDKPLPPIHHPDHVCVDCFDKETEVLLEQLRKSFEDRYNAEQE